MVPMKMRSLFRIYISVAGGQGVWGCGNDFSDSQVWGLRNLLGAAGFQVPSAEVSSLGLQAS